MIAVAPDIVDNATLPEGWEEGALKDYIERPEYGFTDSASDDPSGTKFLRITDIQDGQVDWDTVPYCECPSDVVVNKRLIPGDVVVARIGATTGKSFFIDSPPHEAVFASYLIRLRARPTKLLPRFLYFYMQTTAYWAHVDRHKGDRLKGGVNIPVLESLPIVVPPIEEQARIIRVLDCIHAAARSEATQAAVSADLKHAAMRQLFTRGLRSEAQKETEIGLMPEAWELESLGAHHTVASGGTPSRSNPEFWTGGSIPWVKTTEVDYCLITETEEHITQAGLAGSAAKLLQPGTLLMAMYGQGVTRGKVAILGIEAACNQACAAITPSDDTILPRYLYHFLTWRYDAIRSLAHGGQQQNLNLEIVRDLLVACPTNPDEAAEIVAILDSLDRKVDIHRKKHAALDDLFGALLHKLTVGEASTNDLDLSFLPPAKDYSRESLS
jgi:type I restriction enzyme, S subunit